MSNLKVLTILGTRPEIIRLSRIIPYLDKSLGVANHKILHTGQNWDPKLSGDFFKELNLRSPDFESDNKTHGLSTQLSHIYQQVELAIQQFKPHKALILGDTNSGLSALICERMGVPVYHMEAGNRCYDLQVPEELNRRVIDTISSVNLPYTELSRQNLLREGRPNEKIFVIGNPIAEVLDHYKKNITDSLILQKLNIRSKQYVLVTAHRAENVDDPLRLKNIIEALRLISRDKTIVFSCHPRTQDKITALKLDLTDTDIRICDPLGFFDFVHLEQQSFCAITDSGTVQEEMCIFRRPSITIRNSTERPETVWCGSNIVSGLDVNQILNSYDQCHHMSTDWHWPEGYDLSPVSQKVSHILRSHTRSL